MKYMLFYYKHKLIVCGCLLIGVLIGTLIFNYSGNNTKAEAMLSVNYMLEKFHSSDINRIDLLKYVIQYRFKEIAVLLFAGLTEYRKIIEYIFICYLGIRNSLLICCLVIVFGSSGIFKYIIMLFPHMIPYFVLIYLIISRKEKWKISYLVFVFLIFIFVCLTETFINTWIVNKFIGCI